MLIRAVIKILSLKTICLKNIDESRGKCRQVKTGIYIFEAVISWVDVKITGMDSLTKVIDPTANLWRPKVTDFFLSARFFWIWFFYSALSLLVTSVFTAFVNPLVLRLDIDFFVTSTN